MVEKLEYGGKITFYAFAMGKNYGFDNFEAIKTGEYKFKVFQNPPSTE